MTPKVVIHHANTTNPERCFVRLFKKYTALCSKTENKNPDAPFYLKSLVFKNFKSASGRDSKCQWGGILSARGI